MASNIQTTNLLKSLVDPNTTTNITLPGWDTVEHVVQAQFLNESYLSSSPNSMILLYHGSSSSTIGYIYDADNTWSTYTFIKQLDLSNKFSENFDFIKVGNSQVTVRSTTLPAGTYQLNGTMSALYDPRITLSQLLPMNYNSLPGKTTIPNGKVMGVSVGDGIVSTYLPAFDAPWQRTLGSVSSGDPGIKLDTTSTSDGSGLVTIISKLNVPILTPAPGVSTDLFISPFIPFDCLRPPMLESDLSFTLHNGTSLNSPDVTIGFNVVFYSVSSDVVSTYSTQALGNCMTTPVGRVVINASGQATSNPAVSFSSGYLLQPAVSYRITIYAYASVGISQGAIDINGNITVKNSQGNLSNVLAPHVILLSGMSQGSEISITGTKTCLFQPNSKLSSILNTSASLSSVADEHILKSFMSSHLYVDKGFPYLCKYSELSNMRAMFGSLLNDDKTLAVSWGLGDTWDTLRKAAGLGARIATRIDDYVPEGSKLKPFSSMAKVVGNSLGYSATTEEVQLDRSQRAKLNSLLDDFDELGLAMDIHYSKDIKHNNDVPMLPRPKFSGDMLLCGDRPVTLFPVVIVDRSTFVLKGVKLYALIPGNYSDHIPSGEHYTTRGVGKMYGYIPNSNQYYTPMFDLTMVPVSRIDGNNIQVDQDGPPVSGRSYEAALYLLNRMIRTGKKGIFPTAITGSVQASKTRAYIEPVNTFTVKKLGLQDYGVSLYGNSVDSPIVLSDVRQLDGLLGGDVGLRTRAFSFSKLPDTYALAADNSSTLKKLSTVMGLIASSDSAATDTLKAVIMALYHATREPDTLSYSLQVMNLTAITVHENLRDKRKMNVLSKLSNANYNQLANLDEGEVKKKEELSYDYDTIKEFVDGNYLARHTSVNEEGVEVVNQKSMKAITERYVNRMKSYERFGGINQKDFIRSNKGKPINEFERAYYNLTLEQPLTVYTSTESVKKDVLASSDRLGPLAGILNNYLRMITENFDSFQKKFKILKMKYFKNGEQFLTNNYWYPDDVTPYLDFVKGKTELSYRQYIDYMIAKGAIEKLPKVEPTVKKNKVDVKSKLAPLLSIDVKVPKSSSPKEKSERSSEKSSVKSKKTKVTLPSSDEEQVELSDDGSYDLPVRKSASQSSASVTSKKKQRRDPDEDYQGYS